MLNDLCPALGAVNELILTISDDFMPQSLILTLAALSYHFFAILVLGNDPLCGVYGLNVTGKGLHGIIVTKLVLLKVQILLRNLIVRFDLVVRDARQPCQL